MGDLRSTTRVPCGPLSFSVRTPSDLVPAIANNSIRHRHASLRKTHVNKYALVYHWQGSDDSLKPALLTAHQGQ